MAKVQQNEMDYLNDRDFFSEYIQILNSRLIYSNNRMESSSDNIGDLYDSKNVLALNDNYKALRILYVELMKNNDLTKELIIKVANTINNHAMYISKGFRKLGDDVKFEDKYSIENHELIEEKLDNLIDKYYGEWSNLDIFEREARFNIEFLRIHPFEDGNGRTSRLLLNFNLAKQFHAPVLIPVELREEYFKARNEENVSWISILFRELSKKELDSMKLLIEEFNKEKGKSYSVK